MTYDLLGFMLKKKNYILRSPQMGLLLNSCTFFLQSFNHKMSSGVQLWTSSAESLFLV